MIRLGLTGAMGMGKSTTARMFAEAGVPVYDADAAVHALYALGGEGVARIGAVFPDAVVGGAVDRAVLSRRIKDDPAALDRLEGIVHPLLDSERRRFLAGAEAGGAKVAVLDIPLLYEVGADAEVDAVAVVTAPPEVQLARVLARPGMDAEKFALLSARQTSDAEKRARADFVIDTGGGPEAACEQVQRVLATVLDPQWRPRRSRI